MTLNCDYTGIENYEEKCYYRDENNTLQYTTTCKAISMLTMSCGFGEITEKNWKDIYTRIYAIERAMGPMRLHPDIENYFITPEEVKAFIGLRANVVKVTDAEFRKRLATWMEDGARRQIRNMENAND